MRPPASLLTLSERRTGKDRKGPDDARTAPVMTYGDGGKYTQLKEGSVLSR